MSSLRLIEKAVWSSRQKRSRFRAARRVATGPLKAAAPRHGSSWLISFALFGLAVGAVAVTVSSLSARHVEAVAETTSPASRIAVSSTPVAVRPILARSPLPAAPSAEPLREAKIERAVAPQFKAEALPVLQTEAFDADLAPLSARQPTKASSRRASAAPQR